MSDKKIAEEIEIPAFIEKILIPVKKKYYKDISIKEFRELYFKKFKALKREYKEEKWDINVFHKKTFTYIKNKKKRESEYDQQYLSINLGCSKIRDINEKRRKVALELWEEDPLYAINKGLILLKIVKNQQTGKVQSIIPLCNSAGEIVPLDNREFFERKDGSKRINRNFGLALPYLYRRTVVGVCINNNGIKGVFILELRDRMTEIPVPLNIPIKFFAKLIEMKSLKPESLTEYIQVCADDSDFGWNDYSKEKIKLIKKLLKNNGEEIILFILKSTKNSHFREIEDELDKKRLSIFKLKII